MKKVSKSNGNKRITLSVITVIALIVAIVAILIFSNDSTKNSKQKEIEPNEETSIKDTPIVEEKHKEETEEKINIIPEEETSVDEDKEVEETENMDEQPQPEQQSPPKNAGEKQQPELEKGANDNGYIVDQTLPIEPTYINGVLLVNKKYPLPSTYNPGESVDARVAFENMKLNAKSAGFEIIAFSTFRSFEYQKSLYNRYVERDGTDNADRYSARPGYSEHQTGLAFDIGEVGREDLWLTSEFGESEAGKWLIENAHNYGFILRYPKGKEEITGYMYESWHFRYIGIPLATEVKNSGLTLEEYLGVS